MPSMAPHLKSTGGLYALRGRPSPWRAPSTVLSANQSWVSGTAGGESVTVGTSRLQGIENHTEVGDGGGTSQVAPGMGIG